MITCPRCRQENPDGERHCRSCRAYLGWSRDRTAGTTEPAPPPPAPPAGPHAGSPVPPPPPPPPGTSPQSDQEPPEPVIDPPPPDRHSVNTIELGRTGGPPQVPARTIPVRIASQQPRTAPGAPDAAPDSRNRAAPSVDAVQPRDPVAAGPPRRQPPDRAGGPALPGLLEPGQVRCPRCGRGGDADRRFCRCGATLIRPAQQVTEEVPAARLPWYRRLGEMFGAGRDFRQTMRAANGGLRAGYDVALSARARLFRLTLVLGALGIGATQLGPWSDDVRAGIGEQADRVLPKRYETVKATSVATDPAVRPLPGFDVGFSTDGNPGRAWAGRWRDPGPAALAGAPCARPGGAVALVVSFAAPVALDRVSVQPGLPADNDRRGQQSRPRQIDILFSDGSCASAELADDAKAQPIEVEARDVTNARVQIVDVYPPIDAGDGLVSLSEISFQTRTR